MIVAYFLLESYKFLFSAIYLKHLTIVTWMSPIDLSTFELSIRGTNIDSAFFIKKF